MGGSLAGRIAFCWWVTSWDRGYNKNKICFVLFFSFYSAWRERLWPILADVCVALKAFKGVSYVSVH